MRMVRMYDGAVLIEAENSKDCEVLTNLIFKDDFYTNNNFALVNRHFLFEPKVDLSIIEKWIVEQTGSEVEPLFEF
nr:MAG TPA: hypothetical protein [Caudoviricetes sp.]